jgi:Uma2 family endonuclease
MASVGSKLFTAEEFYDWVHQPENRDRRFELEAGEVIEMPPPGEVHGAVCANCTGILWNYSRQKRRGYVCSNDTGIILERDPDTVRGADIALYLDNRALSELSSKYAAYLPALAVEVLSPTDRIGKMLKRIHLFLAKGVQMVWLLDPESRSITVWQQGQTNHVVFEIGEELQGFALLPDFRCAVADFFVMPGESVV